MRPRRGYWRSRPSCTDGRRTPPIVRFDDLYNLVYDPAVLVVAWSRVRTNRGARSAGVDRVEPRSIASPTGEVSFRCCEMNSRRGTFTASARARALHPQGQRQASSARDRDRPGPHRAGSTQAAPRADLRGGLCSRSRTASDPTGGRRTRSPRSTTSSPTRMSGCWRRTSRRASTRSRTRPSWTGCGDESETSASWRWSRRSSRPASSLRMASPGRPRSGTPQGGILSPLLANIALSGPRRSFRRGLGELWPELGSSRQKRRQKGLAHVPTRALCGRLRRARGRRLGPTPRSCGTR